MYRNLICFKIVSLGITETINQIYDDLFVFSVSHFIVL